MQSYIDELNAFRNWLMFNRLPTNAIGMWHALMMINNSCGWKEWFNCPNALLETYGGFENRMQICRARDSLVKAGLIEYQAGGNQWTASMYHLVSISEVASHYVTPPVTPPVTLPRLDKEKDKEKDILGAENILSNVVCQYFQQMVRPLNNLIEAHELIALSNDYGDAIVKKAIDISVKNGKRSFNYIKAVANNLGSESLKKPTSAPSKKEAIAVANRVIDYFREEDERRAQESGYSESDWSSTDSF